ncbi:hypothetical protein [Halosimplex salinum]|uniref:hypothetical protein n=1 Tax=Halosimplex salinum TaxID=1710538 RepID=UPI000F49A00D|nr:hypothetical protein [Halosimplex salinum]
MPPKETKIRDYDGEVVDVRHLDNIEDGARMEVEHPDGREWVVLLDVSGEVDVEMGRRDGEPADLDVPEWLSDNLSRMARPE